MLGAQTGCVGLVAGVVPWMPGEQDCALRMIRGQTVTTTGGATPTALREVAATLARTR